MNKQINTTPAGFHDQDIEFFVMNGEVQYIRGGRIHLWNEITLDVSAVLRALLDNDPKSLAGIEAMGITDPIDQLHQFAFCNFGEFDKNADIADNGGIVHREYWDCGNRETCPGHGLVCKLPEVPNGKLTQHDVHLAKHIKEDWVNKEIANHLGTSIHTVNRQCSNLAHKIGCSSKPGIAAFAASHSIN